MQELPMKGRDRLLHDADFTPYAKINIVRLFITRGRERHDLRFGFRFSFYMWGSARVVNWPVSFLFCVCHISACKLVPAYFNFAGLIG